MLNKILLFLFLINSLSFSINAKTFECRTVNFSKSTYVGQYYNKQAHGYGLLKWENKHRYIGSWRNNKMDGYGIYYFDVGSYYYGQFEKGDFSGYGVMIYANGKKKEGLWKNDSFVTTTTLDDTILIYALDAARKAEKYC